MAPQKPNSEYAKMNAEELKFNNPEITNVFTTSTWTWVKYHSDTVPVLIDLIWLNVNFDGNFAKT